MATREELKNRIMRRVYIAHAVRYVFRPRVFQLSLIALSTLSLFAFVSISNVVENMPNTFGEQLGFLATAAANTEIGVQFVLGLMLLATTLFVRDVIRLSRMSHFNTY